MQTTEPATEQSEGPGVRQVTASGTRLPTPEAGAADRTTPAQAGGRRWKRVALVLPILLAGLIVAMLFATALGSVSINTGEVFKILLNSMGLFHFKGSWDPVDEIIILQLRLPRVVGAALVGAALAVAGVLLQGLLRNPLADPFLIGTSAGAGLGVTLAFLLPASFLLLGFGQVAAFAFVGALVAVALVYWLARVGGRASVTALLLAGMVVTALMNAFQTLLIDLNADLLQHFRSVLSWLWGGISVENWSQVGIVGGLILVSIIAPLSFGPTLNALALGEEGAAQLGVPVERQKALLVVVASLLTAAAVSIAGLVGFVGLVVPHALRLILGPGHRVLLPVSALGGALFLVVADLLARALIAPAQLPLGALTALVGGPFFLYLLRRSGQNYRW